MNHIATALEYHSLGFNVIPVLIDKRPAVPFKKWIDTKQTEADVRTLFSISHTGVGIITGKISNLVVFDYDLKPETGKITSTKDMTSQVAVKTPSGGLHYYYQYNERVKTSTSRQDGKFRDIKSDGGYVLAPPSHVVYVKRDSRIEGTYEFFPDSDIQDIPVIPETLLQPLIVKPLDELSYATNTPAVTEYSIRTKITSLLTNPVYEGAEPSRNNSLYELSKEYAMTQDDSVRPLTYQNLWSWNVQQCKPPLMKAEFDATFDSGWKKGKEKRKKITTPLNLELSNLGVLHPEKQYFINNTKNLVKVLENDSEITLRYNTLKSKIEYNSQNFTDNSLILILIHLQSKYSPSLDSITSSQVREAVEFLSFKNSYNPLDDYIRGLEYDGVSRVETFLENIIEPYDELERQYFRDVSKLLFHSLVLRALRPGSKIDQVIIFSGAQGVGKTTFFHMLTSINDKSKTVKQYYVVGHHHSLVAILSGTKFTADTRIMIQGCWLALIDEGGTLKYGRQEDLKAFITQTHDTYRKPYGHVEETHPRHCVFSMALNDIDFLGDSTGSRRYVPVLIGERKMNLQYILDNRDQLFAEAYIAFQDKTVTTYLEGDYLNSQREESSYEDPLSEKVARYILTNLAAVPVYKNKEFSLTVADIWDSLYDYRVIERKEQMRLADILKAFEMKKKRSRKGGNPVNRWVLGTGTLDILKRTVGEPVLMPHTGKEEEEDKDPPIA